MTYTKSFLICGSRTTLKITGQSSILITRRYILRIRISPVNSVAIRLELPSFFFVPFEQCRLEPPWQRIKAEITTTTSIIGSSFFENYTKDALHSSNKSSNWQPDQTGTYETGASRQKNLLGFFNTIGRVDRNGILNFLIKY